jgi:hypothetical protein
MDWNCLAIRTTSALFMAEITNKNNFKVASVRSVMGEIRVRAMAVGQYSSTLVLLTSK